MMMFAVALLMQTAEAPPPPALQAKIKRYFDADLLDGPSARWKWPAMRKGPKGIYCGWLNAKNRLGVYIGWKPFYFFVAEGKSHGGVSEGPDDVMIDTFCTKQGYDTTSPPRD